jgi:hypothetical protein
LVAVIALAALAMVAEIKGRTAAPIIKAPSKTAEEVV